MKELARAAPPQVFERDVPIFIELYKQGRLPIDRLKSGTLPLADINKGFDRLADVAAVRQIVTQHSSVMLIRRLHMISSEMGSNVIAPRPPPPRS